MDKAQSSEVTWEARAVRKHAVYLACIGWIIVDAAIVSRVIVGQYEKLLSQLAS